MKQEMITYLQREIRTLDERLLRFTTDSRGRLYPHRLVYYTLDRYIADFLSKQSELKMVILPGFRGVGKTTLMAQLCSQYRDQVPHILFLSVEESVQLFNAGISDLMAAFEFVLGVDLASLQKPVLIFLDEIQSDPKWAVSLKSFFEKTKSIFFCCTGSAALILQTTSNLARRAVFEKIPPLSFSEYQMIKHGIAVPVSLQDQIRQSLYFSDTSEQVYRELLDLRSDVTRYWSHVNRLDIRSYLSVGSLPFSLMLPNEVTVYDAILLLLDKIITLDLPSIGHFDSGTLNVVKRLLFAIAENDVTSFLALEEKFGLNRLTIAGVFDALEKAEVLIRIPAYGSNMSIAKKAAKYLFMSSAIRMAFFSITGLESTYLTRQGKLLEDSVAAHLVHHFISKGQGMIRYDSAEGGADFVLQILNRKQIIIEVGMGNKTGSQIVRSSKKIPSDYNIVFSADSLRWNDSINTVFIPLDYYLLCN